MFHELKIFFESECNNLDEILLYFVNFKNFNLTNTSPDVVKEKFRQIHRDNVESFILNDKNLDILIDICSDLIIEHYEYSQLASRLLMAKISQNIPEKFSEAMKRLYENDFLDEDFYQCVKQNADYIDGIIDKVRDYTNFNLFGLKTLVKSYLIKNKGNAAEIMETPQFLFMRVAVFLNQNDLNNLKTTYNLLSQKIYTHATPTLSSAGLKKLSLASCYLLSIEEDSLEGIFHTIEQCAIVSKYGGGVGVNISNVRSKGAIISSTNGISGGIVPMLKVFNNVSRYVYQGNGVRAGAFAIYLEPWHADFEEFLHLSDKSGFEENIARDLFTAIWCCDLFMKRVDEDGMWSLMCPFECPNLYNVYGSEFEEMYTNYEGRQMYKRQVKARHIWNLIIKTQFETGMPFLLYKDHCNRRANQKHLGTLRGSNLCTEILLHSGNDEIGVCNLASVSLGVFARDATVWENFCPLQCGRVERISFNGKHLEIYRFDQDCRECMGGFDYQRLYETCRIITKNLDKTIDLMSYPLEIAEKSNKNHRPLGIGVQGLMNVFLKLRIPIDSTYARKINRRIFETIYRATIHESINLASNHGAYLSYKNSPLECRGKFQHDLWNDWCEENEKKTNHEKITAVKYIEDKEGTWMNKIDTVWSWDEIRKNNKIWGIRNSQRTTIMPTASTAQIFGNVESIEPLTSNLYVRRVNSGEFVVINEYLIADFMTLGLWDRDMMNNLIYSKGSLQNIATKLPDYFSTLYKTTWEIPQKVLIDLAIERQPFIDQSQSLNLYFNTPNFKKLTSAHFYSWKNGIKTAMYYLRSKAAVEPIQFTVDKCKVEEGNVDGSNNDNQCKISIQKDVLIKCRMEGEGEGEVCTSCQA